MLTESRRDDLFGAIAVIVLLIGTATGNAYALLGMSVAALMLMVVFGRKRLGRGALLAALVAAVTAAVIAIVLTIR
jgi:O-antigen ligase